MSKPKLLDLFCGAGGSAMGYHNAGFEVVGVDNRPQPHYPFEFHCADALEFCREHGSKYDVIHASPPCQAYSVQSRCRPDYDYPELITPTRDVVLKFVKPYVIENVTGARKYLRAPIMLCGKMFGLKVYRHRWFECRPFFLAPIHVSHRDSTPSSGKGISPKGFISIAGHTGNIDYCRVAMGINWMTRNELSQAVPPIYTKFIGKQLISFILAKTSDKT